MLWPDKGVRATKKVGKPWLRGSACSAYGKCGGQKM